MALRSPSPESKFQRYGPDFVTLLNSELTLAPCDPNRRTTLYKHQMEAVLKTKAWFERDWHGEPPKPALIVAPTGSGKTGIVTLLPYVLGCQNAIILSPEPVIFEQQLAKDLGKYKHEDTFYVKTNLLDAEMVKDYMEDVNIMYKSYHYEMRGMAAARLVIVNLHHFSAKLKMSLTDGSEIDNVREKFKYFRTIIVHEAHHYPADSWAAIVEIFRAIGKQIIFVTATQFHGENTPILGPDQEITCEILRQDIIGVSIRDMKFEEIGEIRKEKVEDFTWNDIKILRDRVLGYLTAHDEQMPEVSHKAIILIDGDRQSMTHLAWELGDVATYHEGSGIKWNRFEISDYRKILVSHIFVTEYDNTDISVCVILREVHRRSLFTQFIERCQRLSMPGDPIQAVVLSAPVFQLKQMYNRIDTVREEGEEI